MIRVGVIMGGRSIEREISFNSGRTICDHLDTQLFDVIPLFQKDTGELYILPWRFLYRGKIADFYHRLDTQAKQILWDDVPQIIDFAYIAQHGKYGEDGRLQAILELLQVPYLGTKVFGSALGMKRSVHNDYLRMHNIAVPKGFIVSLHDVLHVEEINLMERCEQVGITFPLVIKPENEGSSFGVFIARDEQELRKYILTSAFISGQKGQAVLVEEKIEGMEFTCILLTDYETGKVFSLPPTEVILQNNKEIFDYEQKYMPGAVNERTPPHCSDQDIQNIKDTAQQAMVALDFTNMARIDGFLQKDGTVVIIDSNPLSGMAPASFFFRQAAEMNMTHTHMINHLIKTELQQYDMVHEQKDDVMDQQKMRVGVLLGGDSNEREISLESGRNVCYKLSEEKYEVTPLFVNDVMQIYPLDNRLLVHSSTREIQESLGDKKPMPWGKLVQHYDFIFIALHGGKGENGVVQGTLEMLGLPYNGSSVFTSALAMDKFKTAKFLAQKGFDTPRSFLVAKEQFLIKDERYRHFVESVGYPLIVKPHNDGCSVMVAKAHNQQELEEVMHTIFVEKSYALIEECIEGMELTVGVVGNEEPRALAPSQAIAEESILSIEEKFLPGGGENQTPAPLAEKDLLFVQEQMVQVYKAAGCKGYARIDCFFQDEKVSPTGKKRVVIIEINSLPGLTPATCLFHQAAEENMRPMDLLDEIIQLGLQEHAQDSVVSVDEALAIQRESK